MSNDNIADVTLRLSGPARAILALLSVREPDFKGNYSSGYIAEIHTAAWYNGRERGVVLFVNGKRKGDKDFRTLAVTFGEHRSSDDIFVDSWESVRIFLNPPIVTDMPEEAYSARKMFKYDEVYAASEHVVGLLREFIENTSRV